MGFHVILVDSNVVVTHLFEELLTQQAIYVGYENTLVVFQVADSCIGSY